MRCQIKIPLTIIIISAVMVKCDYYSSTSGLKILLDTESLMVDTVETYLQAEEFKNSYLSKYLDEVENELENAETNIRDYYENPINSFKTLKRMTRDWRDLHKLSQKLLNEEEYATSLKSWTDFQPKLDDLIGAAKGIARLQRTYGLETSQIANGTLMGIKSSPEMHASDCYDLGISLLQAQDPKNAVSWLIEARLRLAQQEQANKVLDLTKLTDETILGQLNNATAQMGYTKLALLLASEKHFKDPKNQLALESWSKFSSNLSEDRWSRHRAYNKTSKAEILTNEMYEKTCNGQFQQTPAEQRDLRCRYEHNEVPFCRIAPFKVEELSLDPYVAYYYESIYESEIENIFAAAENNVERSKVGGVEGSVSDVRTSKNTWLWYKDHDFLDNLAQRLVDITGLSLTTAEALQVANYGIGGHYGPHYDFFEDGRSTEFEGNRIMTALFYINDVELGGATAFPYLRLAVPPIRRSLVMWYNLHESLELDYRTKHAGCPVIKGSKWICNEWFHAGDQEFYRPCDLEDDGYKSTEFKGLE